MADLFVTINLNDHPRNGDVQVTFRCSERDRKDIHKAAKASSMSSAQFIRTGIIQLARRILAGEGRESEVALTVIDPTRPPGAR